MSLHVALPRSLHWASTRIPTDLDITWYIDPSDCPAAAATADVLWLVMWRTDEIERCLLAGDRLRWVFTSDAGVDSFPLVRFQERGITLTNGRGLHAIPMAEYVVMAMLAAAKGLTTLVRAQDRSEWLTNTPASRELYGTRALIIGYGAIGRTIADKLRCLGIAVTGVRRRVTDERLDDEDLIGPESWRARLAEYDWVILTTPLTRDTRHLMGPHEFAGMKRSAWVLNVARGSVIDQPALEAALLGGQIGGAYLDLTDPEPLPPDSALWHMPNVILTPHSSQASTRTGERALELFLDNLARYRDGRHLRNVVDLDAGY